MALINGTDGNDNLVGTADADQINGLGGDDTINALTRPTVPGSGIDVVDGGSGTDTLVVDASSETVGVQLFSGLSPSYQVRSDSGNFIVDAYNMEKVIFTGGSGGDFIDTGERGGKVDGGGGIDHWTANLFGLFSDVNFTLGTTTAIAAAGLTSILNIEQITLTTGSGDDKITGGAQADTINTGDGNDTIDAGTRPVAAGSGIDVVDGGGDFDTLVVNASAETAGVQLFAGGSPSFQVRSNSGNFMVDAYNIENIKFTGGSGADSINTGTASGAINGGGGIDSWTADLSALTANIIFTLGTTASISAASLTIHGIDRITLTTGGGNDKITGGAQADTITTGNGDDIINAMTRPAAGLAVDVVDGGNGNDTLVVDASAETKAVQLFAGGSPSFQVRSDSGNFYVDAYNIEKVRFTGGSGNDSISTGRSGGTIDGGGGVDLWTADLSALTSGVNFTLGTTTAIGAAGLTSILGLERISLTTGSGNDTITGGAQADTITTGNGDDIINAMTRPKAAGSAVDVVDGGNGTDTLIVDASAETAGVQLFAGGSPSFQVRSDSGNFYVDAYNIEKVRFTGGSGNDSISTGRSGGTIDGGGGIDLWTADLSALTSGVNFTLGTTTAIGAAGLTSILGLERIVLTTGTGDDTITGGAQADTISTGNGNDIINAMTRPKAAGSGIDVVDGGNGTDTLVVDASAETGAVQLFAGGSPSFQVRSDSGNFYVDAYAMEKVVFTGGSAADTASGGSYADILNMGGGADSAVGGGGADVINGGAGNDTLTGGRGADVLTGGTGADSFIYHNVAESRVTTGEIDHIADFQSGVDKIDLADIDANNLAFDGNQAFSFIGAAAFSGVRGELRAVAGLLEADVNGDGIADFRIVFDNGATVGAGDLLV